MRTCCRVVLPVLVLTVLFTAVAVNAGPSEVNAEPSDRILFIPIDLGTLGGTASFAYAINNRGDVVGQSRTTADASTHAFLYRRGTLTDLYPLNSQSVQTGGPTGINDFGDIASGVVHNGVYYPAIYNSRNGEITIIGSFGGTSFGFNGVSTAINNSGQAVGYSYIDDSNRHAFVYSDGVMTDIGSFGGYSGATDINDLGEIVGFASETAHGFAHAFIYSNGVMTEINPFGNPDNDSIARGINNKGQVVGEAANLNGHARNGFIYWGGSITNLGTLAGGRNSFGFSINDRGQVVGRADYPYEDVCFDFRTGKYIPCTKYAYHAFLYDGGVMTALNSLIPENSGWDLQWALDINSRGQIVGFGLLDSRFRAYLLTPVPERCSATLAGCDLSG